MNISPIEPITPAWNQMVRILFKPFDIKKWFLLGFCAFLAQCGENGGGNYGNSLNNNGSGSPYSEFDTNQTKQWISDNIEVVIGLGVGILLLCLAIGLLISWLSSRGKFMLLDGIVKNRGAVKEPWAEFKTEGNSLFLFNIVVGIILFVCFLIISGSTVLIALPDIQDEVWRNSATSAIVFGCTFLIPFIIFCVALSFFVKVFMVPTMYIKRVRAMEGMRIAWSSLCKGHVGSAILLFLMMFVLGIAVTFIAIVVTCATCCIAALPYISSVVFLPVTVFFVSYALCYIQQFGEGWQFFPATCTSCGYDLHGINSKKKCPECGKSLKSDN